MEFGYGVVYPSANRDDPVALGVLLARELGAQFE